MQGKGEGKGLPSSSLGKAEGDMRIGKAGRQKKEQGVSKPLAIDFRILCFGGGGDWTLNWETTSFGDEKHETSFGFGDEKTKKLVLGMKAVIQC